MRSLRAWLIRLMNLFRKTQVDRELSAELDSHLEMSVADNVHAGMAPDEARRRALIALGGVQQTKERLRDRRGVPFIDELTQDVRLAARLLRRDRAFSTTAILVLGFGIGMSNTFFTIVNAACLHGLSLDRPDRVMDISTRDAGGREGRMSYLDFEDARHSSATFAGIAAFAPRNPVPMNVGDEAQAPQRVMGSYVSFNMFGLIGEVPLAGRDFRPEDDRPGAPAVAILGRTVWRDRYGGGASIIGSTIRVNGKSAQIVGVMPDHSKFPSNAEIWLPLHRMPGLDTQKRDGRTLSVLGRLAADRTAVEARTEMETLAAQLYRAYPETNKRFQITVVPVNNRYVATITDPAWEAFISAGVLVLLVACANVANLLLMRSTTRSREFAVRASLGATRGRVIRQLLGESLLLALIGGVLGVALSIVGTRLLWLSIPTDTMPYWMSFTLDRRVLAFITAVCLASSVVFGLTPALQVSKTDVNDLLKDGGRTATRGSGTRRWTSALLITQFALGMVFLALIARNIISLRALERRDPPIATSTLLTASLALPSQTYATLEDRRRFYDRLGDRLRTLETLSSWSMASVLPFGGAQPELLTIQGREDEKVARMVWTVGIGPNYFEAIGLDIVRGRAFDDRDGSTGAESAIVNQRFVDAYCPDRNPIGQRIRITAEGAKPSDSWLKIVGVSPTVRQRDLPEPDPIVYLPLRAAPAATVSVMARSRASPDTLASTLREAVRRLDPDVPLYRVMTLDRAIEDARWLGKLSSTLAVSISLIAVALAAVGLYAVTAYIVAQRMPEIGVRIALGALPWHLAWMTLKGAVRQLGLGLLFGVGCVLAWDRAFYTAGPTTSQLGGLKMSNAIGLMSAAGMLVLIAAVACLVPVLRAMRVNPVVVLRFE